MSASYDLFSGLFEKKYRNMALEYLKIKTGETVLEIGFGTGHCLKQIAELVGVEGRVCGIDISSGMLAVAKRRLEKSGLQKRVELTCDDASKMPYADNEFDAVFMSFTLELFDTPEISCVLVGIKRILKSNGRLGVISLTKDDNDTLLIRFYEWLHQKMPTLIDCRPIFVDIALHEAGFNVQLKKRVSLLGIPADIAIGKNKSG